MAQIEKFLGHEIFIYDEFMYIYDTICADKLKKKSGQFKYKNLRKARIHTSVETSDIIK